MQASQNCAADPSAFQNISATSVSEMPAEQ
jgi:hypothetical protein